MVLKPLRQCYSILIKNLSNHLTNKKKFLGEFIFPVIISILYILMQKQKQQNPLIGIIFSVLLKMYIAMIGLSAIRQLVTLFLNQRQQKHRQYQIIFGLSSRCHTLSNLLYMGLYMSLFLFPFYLTLNYYEFKFHYIGMFAAFVISSLTCSLMMTAFFRDHKIASEIIGMFFSLSSMLALLYSGGEKNSAGQITYTTVDYIAMIIPNSSFAIAIMYDHTKASVTSLWLVKLYMLTYSIIEYPHQWRQLIDSCYRFIKRKCFNQHQEHKDILTQEFNISDHLDNNQNPNSANNTVYATKDKMIKITNLLKTYKIKQGQFNALNKINLTIKKRQIFGLLGRNGAGKTTLVDILTGVSSPTNGSFHINYQKPQDSNAQKVGICYQHQILYEQLTVEQHLYFYSGIKAITTDVKTTIEQIVSMLGIKQEFNKKIKQLSGGNKRKVSVAIALLGSPELMIFDEPTSGLDPLSRRSVWQILQKLKRSLNCSIILTTHHLDEAQVLSDIICVIQKGSIIVQNTTDMIKQKYGNGYYMSLEFESPLHLNEALPSIVAQLQARVQKVQITQKEKNIAKLFLRFSSKFNSSNIQSNKRAEENLLFEILQWLDTIDGIKIEIQKNSLEQSFIAILKDPQNNKEFMGSGDSLQLSNKIIRPIHPRRTMEFIQNQGLGQKCLLISNQVMGIFMRCFYFHKGQVLKFFLTYNINILIFVFSMMFNKFILKVIQSETSNQGAQKNDYTAGIQNPPANSDSFSNSMLILQGYILMAGAFINIPIYEKQKLIRRVFNSRGVSPLAYWLGTFLFDFAYYLLNLFVMSKFISPESFQFTQGNEIWMFVTLGVGILLYTYFISNLFQKITTANTWFSIINVIFGFVLLPMIILGKNTFLGYFDFIKYFYPYYDLNAILMKQSIGKFTGQMMQGATQNQSATQENPKYIYITILIYLFALIALQIRLFSRLKQYFWTKQQVSYNSHNIELKSVSKDYDTVQALKNVSYFVDDQRLALLGHNGAGKSTTFGLLSGQIDPTCGQLFLEHKTKLPYQKIMQSGGICYQQNCLWENLTPLQIFDVFSYLVPLSNPNTEIQWLLESIEFQTSNYNKRFQNLSGGNKRKICMAVALYGDPLIRLLDECSTGLDPSSRVAMVETIKHSASGSTIFTTHSMSEAQTLCSKTVIMKHGSVLQFDYIHKLKQKYYNCYWIDMVFRQDKQQRQIEQMNLSGQEKNNQSQSFLDKNIDFVSNQLKNVLQKFSPSQKKRNQIGSKDYCPKILRAIKQRKMRIQFEKQQYPLHITLKIAYQLRDRLQQMNSNSLDEQNISPQLNTLIESIYISQPKLQDVYIKLANAQSQNQDRSNYLFQEVIYQQPQDIQLMRM